jgi:hypothetical protein
LVGHGLCHWTSSGSAQITPTQRLFFIFAPWLDPRARGPRSPP